MDNATKNMLILSGVALAGGWGGSWVAIRLAATLGLTLGPWGATAGALVGSLLSTSIAKQVLENQGLFDLKGPFIPEGFEKPAGED